MSTNFKFQHQIKLQLKNIKKPSKRYTHYGMCYCDYTWFVMWILSFIIQEQKKGKEL
jgi:hypothetical protein